MVEIRLYMQHKTPCILVEQCVYNLKSSRLVLLRDKDSPSSPPHAIQPLLLCHEMVASGDSNLTVLVSSIPGRSFTDRTPCQVAM